MLGLTIDFLQKSHSLDLSYSVRDGMNVLRFAIKRMMQAGDHPIAKDKLWRQSLEMVLAKKHLTLNGKQRTPSYAWGTTNPNRPRGVLLRRRRST